MKRLFIYAFIGLFLFVLPAHASSLKMITVLQNDFLSENKNSEIILKIIGNYEFFDGRYIPDGTIFNAKPVSFVEPKRGKRDGYVYAQITKYKTPDSAYIAVDNSKAIVKLSKYKPLNIKEKSIDLGTSVAGYFVNNISYPINFVRGVVTADEGENKLVSGAKLTYEKSVFSYISKGKNLNMEAGSKFILTIRFDKKSNKIYKKF